MLIRHLFSLLHHQFVQICVCKMVLILIFCTTQHKMVHFSLEKANSLVKIAPHSTATHLTLRNMHPMASIPKLSGRNIPKGEGDALQCTRAEDLKALIHQFPRCFESLGSVTISSDTYNATGPPSTAAAATDFINKFIFFATNW